MEASKVREAAVQVCHYFKDFLETDFKRQQAPRRKVLLQTDSGFRCGIRLRPYESLERELWSLLGGPSGEPMQARILPRRHTQALSPVLRRIIHEQLQAVDPNAIEAVRKSAQEFVASSYARALSDPEKWVEEVQQHLASETSARLVRPLITKLDGPLQRQAYSVMDSLFAAETDMIAAVLADVSQGLPDVLAKHLAQRDDAAVAQVLSTFLTPESVAQALGAFFDAFVTADAYLELRDLDTYASITEGIQVYLYVGTCKFRDAVYPLLFLPVQLEKLPDGQGLQLTVVNQLFANRAAIDFVLQEIAATRMREWVSPIPERINYLAPEQSVFEEARRLFGNVANAMDLAGQISLGMGASDASTAEVSLSASLYLCAYERGEEALVNDYEALIEMARTSGGAIIDLFEGMVRGGAGREPPQHRAGRRAAVDDTPVADRLVFDSPIPLNEEQRKILLAVRNPEGRIIVVEGPPGTGKSHTITAIAGDCAFNQRSCLVLSDKNEALQVVQDKLSEAMSRVRHDREFPNPLLRLGRQDANFKRLVANQTINQVAAYTGAMRANQPHLEAEKNDTAQELRRAISQTIDTLGSVPMRQVQQLHEREAQLARKAPKVLQALQEHPPAPAQSVALATLVAAGAQAAAAVQAYVAKAARLDVASFSRRLRCDLLVAQFAQGLGSQALASLAVFERLDAQQIRQLAHLVLQYRQLRMPVLGYLLRGGSVRDLDQQLNALPAARVLRLAADADLLEVTVKAATQLRGKLEAAGLVEELQGAYAQVVSGTLPVAELAAADSAVQAFAHFPGALEALLACDADAWPLALDFLSDWLQVQEAFARTPAFDYVGSKTKLERLNTSLMNAHVDGRLVSFMENHRADAKTLSQLIAQRQKFPEDKFDAVRSSFPIIIASIREFSEYMPLVPELFDVVVIDEASQVSVAQALPAILRARKVVVLGDSKQFSNVKSSNASIATNDKYRANLVQFFERNVRKDAEALQRLSMFDVKRSVLEFCSLAPNYSIMLRKHFRSYPELIGYSSRTFYDHQLQAIKVRGVPLDDVIRFDQVDASSRTSCG